MSIKKTFVTGSILILGLGLFAGDIFAQKANQAASRQDNNLRLRNLFIDENGDGICDRSEDGTRPQDGTGNKYRRGAGQGQGNGNGNGNGNGMGSGNGSGSGWSNSSFRGGQGSFGTGICDGTGPKGQALRKGKR